MVRVIEIKSIVLEATDLRIEQRAPRTPGR